MKARYSILIICLLVQSLDGSFVQFAKMVKKKSVIPPLQYMGYGNYCGIGGKGRALDIIDRCCKQHDQCIGIANRRSCPPFSVFTYYMLPYSWFISNGRVYCSRTNSACSMAYCNCDRQCAECFSRHDHHYNRFYKRGMLR